MFVLFWWEYLGLSELVRRGGSLLWVGWLARTNSQVCKGELSLMLLSILVANLLLDLRALFFLNSE